MMKLTPVPSLAALALCAASPAYAGAVLIDFERVTSFASVSNFYAGGADGAGNVGPALGTSFGGDALGLANDFQTYFSHAPSPLGVMVAVGTDATMNVASGFIRAIGLSYSADTAQLAAVKVWSGLDGTGQLLASFDLAANAQAGGCSDSPYCHFDALSRSFNGTARSLTFSGAANIAAFDNISLDVNAVPEPTSAVLAAAGLGVLLLTRRRA